MCWFPDRQVVPLCIGGLDKSKEMSVVSMGGENPRIHISSHFFFSFFFFNATHAQVWRK